MRDKKIQRGLVCGPERFVMYSKLPPFAKCRPRRDDGLSRQDAGMYVELW